MTTEIATTTITPEPAAAAKPALDPRRHAFRDDIADANLWVKVEAATYVEVISADVFWR